MGQQSLPKYTYPYTRKDGTVAYRFLPPKEYRDVLPHGTLGDDYDTAMKLANEYNDLLEDARSTTPMLHRIKPSTKIEQLVNAYYKTESFRALRARTKKQYTYYLGEACKDIGHRCITHITVRSAKLLYENWLSRGVTTANQLLTHISIVFNLAIELDVILRNPFKYVKRATPKPRKVVWTQEQLDKFLEVAYSRFQWRNVGLIAQLAYAWCQRVGDMRNLTWEYVDFEKRQVELHQSKRDAYVYLPIDDDLYDMLKEQHNDFGFQEYVAPSPRPHKGKYKPYSQGALSQAAKAIKRQAGLPEKLRIMDLRRTGVTELVDAGVDIVQIQQVTGHTSLRSVAPYIKNTLSAAKYALDKRKESKQ